ncbi:MAG: hypothetical protein KAY13_06800 [Zoogloea sp.]|nr:hypothetical protein [Zoogloea sp.]
MKTTSAITASLLASFALGTAAHAGENPFSAKPLEGGYQLAQADTKMKEEPKMKDASCGADKKKSKKADGSCAANKKMDKKADGSCGGDKKADGKCGGDKK